MKFMNILKIFLAGWCVLLVAIILNIAANLIGVLNWYSFLENIQKFGLANAFKNTSFISIIFMFLIYPFLLGLFAFLVINFRKISDKKNTSS